MDLKEIPIVKAARNFQQRAEENQNIASEEIIDGASVVSKIATKIIEEIKKTTEPEKIVTENATVICTYAKKEKEEEGRMLKNQNESGVKQAGIEGLGEKGIKFIPFSRCTFIPECTKKATNYQTNNEYHTYLINNPEQDTKGEHDCIPSIEGETWQEVDKSYLVEEELAILKETSYMFCTKGYGLISTLTDGQRNGELELVIAKVWVSKWLDGKTKEWDEVDYQKTKLATYILWDKKDFSICTPYISYETIEALTKLGMYNKNMLTPFMVADLNRVLGKYGITSKEHIQYFLTECMTEGVGNIGMAVDGFPIENGSLGATRC